jgi:hypothetical protein
MFLLACAGAALSCKLFIWLTVKRSIVALLDDAWPVC